VRDQPATAGPRPSIGGFPFFESPPFIGYDDAGGFIVPLPRLSEANLEAVIRTAASEEVFLIGYMIGYLDHAGKTPAKSHVGAMKAFAASDIFTTAGRAAVKAAMAAHVND
jgi:hypothetical protein